MHLREEFFGHLPFKEKDFLKLWKNATFVFDTSTLLDLYQYSEEARNDFIDILRKLNNKIWIPKHVMIEFCNNRFSVINKQNSSYSNLRKDLSDIKNKIESGMNKYKFQMMDKFDEFKFGIISSIDKSISYIDTIEGEGIIKFNEDLLLDDIIEIFDSNCGEGFDEDALLDIYKEGRDRYKKKIPPGYMDNKDKDEPDKFGDLVIWKEIIKFGDINAKDIIFITSDSKEDWWKIIGDRIICPRPELINEYYKETGKIFYAYSPKNFSQRAKDHIKDVDVEAIIRDQEYIKERERLFNEVMNSKEIDDARWKIQQKERYLRNKYVHEEDIYYSTDKLYAGDSFRIEELSFRMIIANLEMRDGEMYSFVEVKLFNELNMRLIKSEEIAIVYGNRGFIRLEVRIEEYGTDERGEWAKFAVGVSNI